MGTPTLEIKRKRMLCLYPSSDDKRDLEAHQQDLFAILMNHEGSRPVEEDDNHAGENGNDVDDKIGPPWKDPLLPPIACTILSGGVPKVAAAVMLSQIISRFMPTLTTKLYSNTTSKNSSP